MGINKKIKQKYLPISRWKAWLFCLLSATLILACTGDLDNDGYALVSPSFGITVVPQNTQVAKGTANAVAYAATGGVTPYTYSLGATDIGNITAAGVFTSLAIAGTATVTAVDSTGVSGTTTVTVLPKNLVVVPGTAVNTEAGAQIFTATLNSASGIIACSISDSNLGSATTIAKPSVAAANLVCTVTSAAVPAAGAANETFTITIVDIHNGDHATATLTLAHPTGSPGF